MRLSSGKHGSGPKAFSGPPAQAIMQCRLGSLPPAPSLAPEIPPLSLLFFGSVLPALYLVRSSQSDNIRIHIITGARESWGCEDS